MTATPDTISMDFHLTTKNSSGQEIPVRLGAGSGLKKIDTGASTLTYQATVKADANTSYSYWNGTGAEEFIKSVAEKRPVQLKLIGPTVGTSADIPKYADPLPMTNCAQVYGSGRHKVVYIRGESANLNAISLSNKVRLAVDKGFRAIEPYKTYVKEFSLLTDLKNHYDSSWRDRIANIIMPGPQVFPEISNASSCGKLGSAYIGLIKMPTLKIEENKIIRRLNVEGIASQRGKHILMNPEPMLPFELVSIHEFSHIFGGLFDESAVAQRVTVPYGINLANCSYNPSKDYTFGGRLYGKIDVEGCAHGFSDQNGKKLYHPSAIKSLMNDSGGWSLGNTFNVVSCGYILKAIKKGGTAHSYFPECAAMPAGIIPVGEWE